MTKKREVPRRPPERIGSKHYGLAQQVWPVQAEPSDASATSESESAEPTSEDESERRGVAGSD